MTGPLGWEPLLSPRGGCESPGGPEGRQRPPGPGRAPSLAQSRASKPSARPAGSGAPAVPVPVATSLSLPASLLNHQESKTQLPSGFRFSRQVAVSLSRCLGARRPGARSAPARRAAEASGAYLRPCQRTARGRGRSRQGGSPPEPSPPPPPPTGGPSRGGPVRPRAPGASRSSFLPPTPPPPSPAGGTAARLRSRCRGDSPRRANTALCEVGGRGRWMVAVVTKPAAKAERGHVVCSPPGFGSAPSREAHG